MSDCNSLPSLFFVFPYRGVGGVSSLFLRLAEFLGESGKSLTWVVDYPDGFMASHRRAGLTKLLPYDDGTPVNIPDNAVAIFQSMTPWSIYPSLRFAGTTRILFWNCHPFNLVPTLPGARRLMQSHLWVGKIILNTLLIGYKLKLARLVKIMLKHKALVFMDSVNRQTTENYLGLNISEPVYIPIPASPPTGGFYSAVSSRDFGIDGVRVAWIGRIVDFKYHVLLRALIELNDSKSDFSLPISVTIVGDGDYSERLRRDANSLQNISFQFIEHLSLLEIDRFLLENVDLLLAMGTCALDGAKLGIPTLLLDFSYKPVPSCYMFQWLQNRDGSTLGDHIGPQHLIDGTRSIADRLNELIRMGSALSDSGRAYVDANHNISKIANHLISVANSSSCSWHLLEGAAIMGRGFIYSVYDVIRKRWVTR